MVRRLWPRNSPGNPRVEGPTFAYGFLGWQSLQNLCTCEGEAWPQAWLGVQASQGRAGNEQDFPAAGGLR